MIRKLYYWEKSPEDCTCGRIFKLFNQRHCNELYEAEDETRKKLWAGCGEPDAFHIRIWEGDHLGNETVTYDNGSDQPISSGSIVIHTQKK